jgi:hypothetical protein
LQDSLTRCSCSRQSLSPFWLLSVRLSYMVWRCQRVTWLSGLAPHAAVVASIHDAAHWHQWQHFPVTLSFRALYSQVYYRHLCACVAAPPCSSFRP